MPRRAWEIPEREATSESAFLNRRRFLKGLGAVSLLPGCGYERSFEPRPWQVTVDGLVQQPRTWDVDALIAGMPLEERLYRHRCVEAWSMAIPWTGFAMKSLIDEARPLSSARYVKMTSFLDPKIAQGQWDDELPWPYVEALTMDEAANELTLLVTGVYGHELPKQHGAPLRLIVPWKYGFKGIKSIVRFEFTAEKPATFWNTASPGEYEFDANVDPAVPHPGWSQERERFILSETETEDRATLPFNGYGEFVAGLYG